MLHRLMTKVHPNIAIASSSDDHHLPLPNPLAAANSTTGSNSGSAHVVLTVWKKSLLFNCDGFTVFDPKGNLIFRVDNYMTGGKGEIFLMDASGKSLLTIRRKKLSLADNWLVFDGEEAVNPRYSVRKLVNILNSRSSVAQVSAISFCGKNGNGNRVSPKKRVVYEIEGSYAQRCCTVYDDKRRIVAEIKPKEAIGGMVFGVDVFRLIANEPGIELAVAMALVIILDEMFGYSFISSSRRFGSSTHLC